MKEVIKQIALRVVPELIGRLLQKGRRGYAVVVSVAGTGEVQLTSTIHPSKAEAEAHAARIAEGRSFVVVGIVSFRNPVDEP